jgi:hypothetical protein
MSKRKKKALFDLIVLNAENPTNRFGEQGN